MTTTFPGCTMIATLGGKPELVTLALDALLAAGEAVDEVIVLHPSAAMPRIRAALQTLQGEFAHRRYRGRPCHFQPIALRLGEPSSWAITVIEWWPICCEVGVQLTKPVNGPIETPAGELGPSEYRTSCVGRSTSVATAAGSGA